MTATLAKNGPKSLCNVRIVLPRRFFRLARRCVLATIAFGLMTFMSRSAMAVRPFVTDDARVVGDRALQFETWLRVDKHGIEHWILPAVGPVAPLELTFGGFHGTNQGSWGSSFPLFQMKVLAVPTRTAKILPGLAFVSGTLGPAGGGPLKGDHWDTFAFAALSESLLPDDKFLVHQNLGVFATTKDGARKGTVTWGLGTQINLVGGLHFCGELFSGDPYAATPGVAIQAGVRHFVSRIVQIDATLGRGVSGDGLPLWGSIGLRIASDPYFF
ncbi:MAG: hypothetical protein KF795_00405 [Labilithrix sp.]|nr:hypothetical protein [Labilithrix sp.]